MPEKQEIEKWHRWFAVECNNAAWDLASKSSRTPGEDRQMLLAAHAAAFHWSKAGQEINGARADFLLGHAYALAGDGGNAMKYAQSCLAWCESNPCEDWDIAFAHAGISHAAAVLGDAPLHAKHHAIAETLGHAIKDEEDRKLFMGEFARLPLEAHGV